MFWAALTIFLVNPLPPSAEAVRLGEACAAQRAAETVEILEKLVAFKTLSKEGVRSLDQPEVVRMSAYLKALSAELGFDFADYGEAVVIGMGKGPARLGLIAHGDVQPADPSKWKQSPFSLDKTSEPGRLVGRGTIDDKGPIAVALQAMKAIAVTGKPLKRRIELIISYTEESDWDPFKAFLAANPPPELNVALDSDFPVTSAEKGWSGLWFSVAPLPFVPQAKPLPPGEPEPPMLAEFLGGSFLAQVPEDATALIRMIDPAVLDSLKKRATTLTPASFTFEKEADGIRIRARGKSAHSAEPEKGVNAITYLAALLEPVRFAVNAESQVLDFINQLIGTGYKAEKWGNAAYSHDFMGPLTLNLGYVRREQGQLAFAVNLRAPAGKSKEQLEREVTTAVDQWQQRSQAPLSLSRALFTEPHIAKDAPHVPSLLGIFSHFAQVEQPKPISIGGGSHARLVPFGVNFGPNMPGDVYTGHSEHEYLESKNLLLLLKMYTAMLYELAVR